MYKLSISHGPFSVGLLCLKKRRQGAKHTCIVLTLCWMDGIKHFHFQDTAGFAVPDHNEEYLCKFYNRPYHEATLTRAEICYCLY